MKNPFLSIVIPTYNEEQNIKNGTLQLIYSHLASQPFTYEVLFVDDGSSDSTANRIQNYIKGKNSYTLLKSKHQGKALTVSYGINNAKGANVLFCDFDQATPLSELNKLLPFIKEDFDIIIGSRKDQRTGAPFSRKIMAKGFILLRTLLLGLDIQDTQCGFKLFTRECAETLFKKLKLYHSQKTVKGSHVTAGFDVELLYLAKKMGFKVKEVPVIWNYKETRRVSPVRDSIEGFTGLVKIRMNDIRGKYN